MRKLFFTLFALAMPLMVVAEPIGQEKALQIASQFMSARGFGESLEPGSMNGRKAAPAHRLLKYKDIGMKNLYAFADEANGGFVVVSGDDRVEPVLAYSMSEELNVYNMPEAMQVMLLSFDQQIGKLSKGSSTVRKAPIASSRSAIVPLIKTKWHQYLPLSYNCPYDKQAGRNKLVGCVAVTLAQLMYYYQHPKSTTMPIPAYTTYEGDKMPELPPTTFEYSKMHLNYSYVGDSERETINPDESLDAVTKLMMYAGCALEMQYSTSGSASVFDNSLIAKYFDYDKGARYLLAGNYPHDVWEEMVYQELKAGRPVPYSAGAVGNQSHEFIIDGYDGMGLFHTNLGEPFRGSFDSFFRLGVLNDSDEQTVTVEFSGYNVGQAAYFGFQPNKGNDAVPIVSVDYGTYSLSKTEYTRSSSDSDFEDIVLGGTMMRYDDNGKTMDYGWGLFQYGLLQQELCSSTTSQTTATLDQKFSMGSQLADGTYQLFPIFRNHGAKSWEEYLEYRYTVGDGIPMRHYTATVKGNKLTIGVSSAEPNLKVDKVEYFAPYEGEKLDMRVWLTNNGTNYENEVFLWIDNEEIMRTGVGAYIDPGKKDYIDFCTAAPTKGTHDVRITTDWEGKKTIYTGKLTITDAPDCILEAEATTKGFDENRDVHGALDVVLTITNTGNTTFRNMISAYVMEYLTDEEGHLLGSEELGLPTYNWRRIDYLQLEPGESAEMSYTIGNTILKPNDYKYSFSVNYYNNHDNQERLLSLGYFRYFLDAAGIPATTVQKNADDGIYYDLQGRRVDANQLKHGVYIHSNKKILIK